MSANKCIWEQKCNWVQVNECFCDVIIIWVQLSAVECNQVYLSGKIQIIFFLKMRHFEWIFKHCVLLLWTLIPHCWLSSVLHVMWPFYLGHFHSWSRPSTAAKMVIGHPRNCCIAHCDIKEAVKDTERVLLLSLLLKGPWTWNKVAILWTLLNLWV